ncbi:methyltransferase domain-containing protein [Candidatus Pacearchaeota archaeon]|nr:methyltransferase domain-containing protein [Candidatus Pacearchaeota archaeon]
MSSTFNPIEYKINTRTNWNTVASQYHNNWANSDIGPFKSTKELVKAAEIKPDDSVLDVACGTGVVSKEISHLLGNSGTLVGIDISQVALGIAKKSIQIRNADFIEMDAENLGFHVNFDKMVCQYGLMFFPDAPKVLKSISDIMKKDGKIAIAVHGTQAGVPYFRCIMNSILHYIPDIKVKGTPTVHRFGNPEDLQKEISAAGFSDIKIKKFTFTYHTDNFEEYWIDYMNSTANSIWPKIKTKGTEIVNAIKKEAEKNTSQFIKNEKIEFPWDVLIATAYK